MTTGKVETQGQGDTRNAFARVTSLLELPREQRLANGQWEDEVRTAFRRCLTEELKPHLVSTVLQRVPLSVALEVLHDTWNDLPLKIRGKIIGAFRQTPALLPLSVGLAGRLVANSADSEAAESAAAALHVLKRPDSRELRDWIEGGGLEDLAALLTPLRDRLPDLADHVTTLITAAERGAQATTKQTVRAHIAAFARNATALVDSAGLEQDQYAILSSRLGALTRCAEQALPGADRKEPRRTARTTPQRGPHVAAAAPKATQPPSKAASAARSEGAKGSIDLTNPRALIDALGQIVKLLEELEERRGQAALSDQLRAEKLDVENQLAGMRETLANETRIVASLKTRVGELEEHAENLTKERESGLRRCSDLERRLDDSESRYRELERDRARLLDELPEQRLAESRARIRTRIRPILAELDEFRSHPDLPHEALAFLDRYRSLKEILAEEMIADA